MKKVKLDAVETAVLVFVVLVLMLVGALALADDKDPVSDAAMCAASNAILAVKAGNAVSIALFESEARRHMARAETLLGDRKAALARVADELERFHTAHNEEYLSWAEIVDFARGCIER